jgi:translation initiation factor IF-2
MIKMNPVLVPPWQRIGVTEGQGFELIGDLLRAVADPAAAQKRLGKLQAASEEATRRETELDQREAELDKREAEQDRTLAVEREQHEAALAAERQRDQQEQQQRERVLRQREVETEAKLKAATERDAASAKRHAELEKRLKHLQIATAPAAA